VQHPYGVAPPGHRLPEETHVGAVRLQVSDLARSIAYYETVVGLRVTRRQGNTASLGPHEGDRDLVHLHERPGARAARGEFGLYHFAILLPDRAALGRFAAHLERLGVRAGMADHFVSEAIYLQDPDNLGIEVYADRPRDLWEHQGGELVMATEPLNVGSVIAAGKGEPWRGAPAGTVMGHVHLHVGDLHHANRFYHEALGLDRMVWSYPGALFLAAGGYHHHLGTNVWSRGPSATVDQAKLLEWELVLPSASAVAAAARSLDEAGFPPSTGESNVIVRDPWGTGLRLNVQ